MALLATHANVHARPSSRREPLSQRATSPLPRNLKCLQPEPEKVDLSGRPLANGLLAIAASTGGPKEVVHILANLPKDFPFAVVIAQHIAAGFAGGLVRWLSRYSAIPVVLARGDEPLVAGVAYVSPTEHDLVVTRDHRTALAQQKTGELYHPCCDSLLYSAARWYGHRCLGVILTGMGRDGACGMEAIHLAGGITIAQDEETSVVFGMNGVAVKRGAIQHILPSSRIPEAIRRFVVKETGKV